MKKLSRGASLLVVLLAYVLAFLAGLLVYRLSSPPLLAFFLADVAATLVVWGIGLIFRNASLYDPYWSVAPAVLFFCFMLVSGRFDALSALYLALFLIWGTRLTLNWVIGWKSLAQQDWRYTMLHDTNPKLYFLTNLFGINLIPTLFVFAALVPAYLTTLAHGELTILTLVGAAVCLGAPLLQFVADAQLRRFRFDSANKGHSIDTGLWKYSRHPQLPRRGVFLVGRVAHSDLRAAAVLVDGNGARADDAAVSFRQHPHDGKTPAVQPRGLCGLSSPHIGAAAAAAA